jgi:SAM-dependent methyltransferase
MHSPTMGNPYLSGTRLYGDDLSLDEIARWVEDERNAYFELTGSGYNYSYHALNLEHGFRHLPPGQFRNVLGIGSAYGDEFLPIRERLDEVTILEPAGGFQNPRFRYVEPEIRGVPFADESFNLITCLGVLHHIPNVSTMVKELARVLACDGYLLLREPIVSMGDWNRPRPGLTKHERGIPLAILRRIIGQAGLRIERETKCGFSLTSRWNHVIRRPPFNQRWVVRIDKWLSRLPIWNGGYHPSNLWQRLRPMSVYYVLRKGTPSAVASDAGSRARL